MQKMLIVIPDSFETDRLILRRFKAGDGPMYYDVSQRNQDHLARYESGNVIMSIENEESAEVLVRELGVEWDARNCFFMGGFDKGTDEFVTQIYIGPVKWVVPEFLIGFFVDKGHEGKGYVTEAVKGALSFIYRHLQAHRVRLECDDTNERSWRVAERCGMIREGHIRENKLNPDGSRSGTLHYGLLRNEYDALVSESSGLLISSE